MRIRYSPPAIAAATSRALVASSRGPLGFETVASRLTGIRTGLTAARMIAIRPSERMLLAKPRKAFRVTGIAIIEHQSIFEYNSAAFRGRAGTKSSRALEPAEPEGN